MDEAPAMLPRVFIQWRSIIVFFLFWYRLISRWLLDRVASVIFHLFLIFSPKQQPLAFAFQSAPVIPLLRHVCFSPFISHYAVDWPVC